MTTTRTIATNKILGHSNTTTSTLHCHLRQHKPTETNLFDLLPQEIVMEIDLLASELEHRKKIKAIITKINHLFNPIVFAVTQEIWYPYHNFSVYGSWYNECSYTWAHRCVPTHTHLQYQHIIASYYMVIETLTQQHLDFNKTVTACQHITWDKKASVPYFRQTILDSYIDHHATWELLAFPGWWPRIWNLLCILFHRHKTLLCSFSSSDDALLYDRQGFIPTTFCKYK